MTSLTASQSGWSCSLPQAGKHKGISSLVEDHGEPSVMDLRSSSMLKRPPIGGGKVDQILLLV